MSAVIALLGNPNCGKTTLFNKLTGLNQKVGNYAGVTVERRWGTCKLSDREAKVVDLPGTYSLISRSRDEAIAFEVLTGRGEEARPDLAVLVVDASNLDRNLYLALSILELGIPAVIALNMIDVAQGLGLQLDEKALSKALGVPVVPIVAKSGQGVDALKTAMQEVLQGEVTERTERDWKLDEEDEAAIAAVRDHLDGDDGEAIWLLSSLNTAQASGTVDTEDDPLAAREDLQTAAQEARAQLKKRPDFAARVIKARYEIATRVAEEATPKPAPARKTATDRADAILLHPVLGALIFVVVMAVLFQSIFAWAEPLMGLIEGSFGGVQGAIKKSVDPGPIRDLIADGIIGGVGSVLVFIPQIAILFLFIAVLEDSGYLARAAFISDRLMARIGLHGRAFVPLLSGFACAVPAIMATRSIENRKDRLVTILVAPLISCSARLPVYALLIAALFNSDKKVFGFLSVGGLLLLAMYGLSVMATVVAAFVLKRTLLKSPTPPLVLELPPYRAPEMMSVLRRVYERCKVFVRDAGTVILACSIVLWALLYFPRTAELSFNPADDINRLSDAFKASIHVESDPVKIKKRKARFNAAIEQLKNRARSEKLQQSFAGRIGHAMEPVIEPLGYDWKIGVGLLASFAAREVMVSTMGLVYGVGEADEESTSLREAIRKERHPKTGKPVYTPLVGLSLMVFFVLACQCMSTVAVVKRETNSWRWPIFMVVYMTVLAWVGAFIVYQGGRLLGFH